MFQRSTSCSKGQGYVPKVNFMFQRSRLCPKGQDNVPEVMVICNFLSSAFRMKLDCWS